MTYTFTSTIFRLQVRVLGVTTSLRSAVLMVPAQKISGCHDGTKMARMFDLATHNVDMEIVFIFLCIFCPLCLNELLGKALVSWSHDTMPWNCKQDTCPCQFAQFEMLFGLNSTKEECLLLFAIKLDLPHLSVQYCLQWLQPGAATQHPACCFACNQAFRLCLQNRDNP